MSLVCVGSTRSVLATLGLLPLTVRAFPSTLLRLQNCSRLLYRERALSCVHVPGLSCSGSSFWVFHKGSDSVWPVFCAFPSPSSSGSQELEKHTLTRCSVPYPLHGPCLSFHACRLGVPCVSSGELVSSRDPPGGCQPSRFSGSLSLETGSLFALW